VGECKKKRGTRKRKKKRTGFSKALPQNRGVGGNLIPVKKVERRIEGGRVRSRTFKEAREGGGGGISWWRRLKRDDHLRNPGRKIERGFGRKTVEAKKTIVAWESTSTRGTRGKTHPGHGQPVCAMRTVPTSRKQKKKPLVGRIWGRGWGGGGGGGVGGGGGGGGGEGGGGGGGVIIHHGYSKTLGVTRVRSFSTDKTLSPNAGGGNITFSIHQEKKMRIFLIENHWENAK